MSRQIRTYGDVLPKLIEFISIRYFHISTSKRIILFMDRDKKVSIVSDEWKRKSAICISKAGKKYEACSSA